MGFPYKIAERYKAHFGAKIIETCGLPRGTYKLLTQDLEVVQGLDEMHLMIKLEHQESGKVFELQAPSGDGEEGGPFFWDGDTDDIIERTANNTGYSTDYVRDLFKEIEG